MEVGVHTDLNIAVTHLGEHMSTVHHIQLAVDIVQDVPTPTHKS